MYVAAYREQRDVEVFMQKTHKHMTPWMCPSFPDDAAVKDDFCQKLCGHIKTQLAEIRALHTYGKCLAINAHVVTLMACTVDPAAQAALVEYAKSKLQASKSS